MTNIKNTVLCVFLTIQLKITTFNFGIALVSNLLPEKKFVFIAVPLSTTPSLLDLF